MGQETAYDAVLLVAFGGPEGPDQVGPFLERVTAGRGVPPGRLAEVAARYERFGGVSPINGRMRSLAAAVTDELAARRHDLPVFWGNRNAPPLLADVVASIRDADRPVRPHHDHPGLIGPTADRLAEALAEFPEERRVGAHLLFSAHSLPTALAATCGYVDQLRDAARLVAERVDPDGGHPWEVVWQSRSGSPHVPWLEPDVGDRIESLAAEGVRAVAVSPLGMPVENFEIAWDLDLEAAQRAESAGVTFVRARAIDDDARFASMVVDLFEERLDPTVERKSLGGLGLRPDSCPADCCPAPARS